MIDRSVAVIYERLKEYDLSNREASKGVPLGVFPEDAQGRKQAGPTGETIGNRLCIKYLFVGETLRGKGIGRRLIEAAETEARNRGCRYSFVDTFSFQALGFYRRLRYEEVFVLKEYPSTGSGALLHEGAIGSTPNDIGVQASEQ